MGGQKPHGNTRGTVGRTCQACGWGPELPHPARTAMTGGFGATRKICLGSRSLYWSGGVGIKEGFLEEVKTKNL